jgi:tetratricopeptide (TPR) repeat protein
MPCDATAAGWRKDNSVDRTPFRSVILLAALVGLLGQQRLIAQPDPLMAAHEASDMTEEQAKELEQAVEENPNDLTARTKLLGYYFQRHLRSPTAKAARGKHILWVIENHPESTIAGSPYARLDAVLEQKEYTKAKELWLKQAERHAKDPVVLGNAAEALLIRDKETARKLLEQAKALDSRNPDWPRRLAQLYDLQGSDAPTPEARKELAGKAIAEQRHAIELSPAGTDRFYLLTELPAMALDAGRPEEAKAAAEQLLDEAQWHPKDWNYGNAIHKGHITLGRVALQSGDTAVAKRHLLEAGKTPGSPQLDSFGPDFTLATELLEKGEREAVTEYLKSVGRFWKMGRDHIERWVKVMEGGGKPDFSPAGRFSPPR